MTRLACVVVAARRSPVLLTIADVTVVVLSAPYELRRCAAAASVTMDTSPARSSGVAVAVAVANATGRPSALSGAGSGEVSGAVVTRRLSSAAAIARSTASPA